VLIAQGRVAQAAGRSADAATRWRRALAVIEPDADGGDAAPLALRAEALVYLRRLDEARQVMQALAEKGHARSELVALCRAHGIEVPAPEHR
jgi:hypothetical protein